MVGASGSGIATATAGWEGEAVADAAPAGEGTKRCGKGRREVYYIQSASAVTEGSSVGGAGAARGEGQGRFRNAMARGKSTDTFYEVRLDSWNCSCAAFAFQSFGLLGVDGNEDSVGPAEEGGVLGREARSSEAREVGGIPEAYTGEGEAPVVGEEDFMFGGTVFPGGIAPVCKHILAAAMAKNLPEFVMPPGRDAIEGWREVTTNDLAGWGAGWGERF